MDDEKDPPAETRAVKRTQPSMPPLDGEPGTPKKNKRTVLALEALMGHLPPDPSREYLRSVFFDGVLCHAFRLSPSLRVLMSLEMHPKGRRWLHALVSFTDQTPFDMHTLNRVRRSMFAPDAGVVHVWPYEPTRTLHFWCRLDKHITS